VSGGHETYRSPDGDNSLDWTVRDDVSNIFRDGTQPAALDGPNSDPLIGSIESTDEGGCCKMDWWGWLLIVIACCVVGMVACGGPKNFCKWVCAVICCPCLTCAAAVGCGVCVSACQDDDKDEDEDGYDKDGKTKIGKASKEKICGFTSPFEDENKFKKDVSKKLPCLKLCFDIDEVFEEVKVKLDDVKKKVEDGLDDVKKTAKEKLQEARELAEKEAKNQFDGLSKRATDGLSNATDGLSKRATDGLSKRADKYRTNISKLSKNMDFDQIAEKVKTELIDIVSVIVSDAEKKLKEINGLPWIESQTLMKDFDQFKEEAKDGIVDIITEAGKKLKGVRSQDKFDDLGLEVKNKVEEMVENLKTGAENKLKELKGLLTENEIKKLMKDWDQIYKKAKTDLTAIFNADRFI